MNIGFVSSWCEQGSAYVTRQYIDLLKDNNNIFVYARQNQMERRDNGWNQNYVTWAPETFGTMNIFWPHFKRWINNNRLDVVFFNEQQDMDILAKLKQNMPELKIGSYIDYYKRDTVEKFKLYDFLICNTKRHYSVFNWHPQCYYVRWGTDTELFKYQDKNTESDEKNDSYMITFFHSGGNGDRKGTMPLLETFLSTDLHTRSKLIIHTQVDIIRQSGYSYDELKKKNVEVIEKTVTAPGLYHMGDVYVYPTILDGLGLSLYEALSCGLPVVGTDVAPINEVIENNKNGRLVKVQKIISREDGYYWPLSFVDSHSLYEAMNWYIDHADRIENLRYQAREDAVLRFRWSDRKQEVNKIFSDSKVLHLYDYSYLRNYVARKTPGEKLNRVVYFVYLNLKKKIGRKQIRNK